MLDNIKAVPEKIAFLIGISLILSSGFISFFIRSHASSTIVQGFIICVATLFVLSAADQRHSKECNK